MKEFICIPLQRDDDYIIGETYSEDQNCLRNRRCSIKKKKLEQSA